MHCVKKNFQKMICVGLPQFILVYMQMLRYHAETNQLVCSATN